ncbi:MAG: NADH-quinone oxidoreductase subunit J [Deltaproteobacteria bacterium]|nr:NADH-quinone oxidoreductase subunit J [Deltaproteobacteria bacterium]
MTLYALFFYLIAGLILVTAALAITRRNPVHAVVYLILSFLGSAMLFYLFGAPFLAALMVIIYAGAIMVLFLFVIMMVKPETATENRMAWRQWEPAIILSLSYFLLALMLVFTDPRSQIPLKTAMASPMALGRFVFERYWFSVEIISLVLLIGLMAAVQLGRQRGKKPDREGL